MSCPGIGRCSVECFLCPGRRKCQREGREGKGRRKGDGKEKWQEEEQKEGEEERESTEVCSWT